MSDDLEVTLIAKFEGYAEKKQDILEESKAGRWSPSTTTFMDVAHQGGIPFENMRECGDVRSFLDAIQTRQEGRGKGKPRADRSVRRVNLFAHGDGKTIWLKGIVKQPPLGASTPDIRSTGGTTTELNTFVLDMMENQSEAQQTASQRIFGKNAAGIFFYPCEAGGMGDVLQRLANYFRVNVYGFNGLIEYCPLASLEKGTKPIERGRSGLFYKIGETKCNTYDFHALKPSVPKSPEKSPGEKVK